jgi:branched-chain amino acid transport system ATP-binding protein
VVIELSNVHAGYGVSRVLFGVSLRADRGEIVALLGRNGAGKSTALKAIMGIARPSAGHVLLDGAELGAASSDRASRHRTSCRTGVSP